MESFKKVYDLKERTFVFAKNIQSFVKKLENNIWNKERYKTSCTFIGLSNGQLY